MTHDALLTDDLATAPDFCLTSADGRQVCLTDYTNSKHIVLVFNRGFA